MPKMTAKYTAALSAGRAEGLKQTGEDLYKALAERNYSWNNRVGLWECLPMMDADPPTTLIHFRVWADAEIVADVADDTAQALKALGFILQEKSDPYPCRPPKQLEARVYLIFQPPAKKKGN